MARPNMLKLIGKQQEKKATTNNYLNGMTSKSFKEDNSTKFVDTSQYQKYINPEYFGTSGFDFTSDYEKDRAINQSNWEQAGRTLTKIVPKTILEFMGQVGNVLDLEDYSNSNNEVGNWLNTWAQEQKVNLDKALPTYRENPNEALDVGDFAWWMQNGSSLVESASAFVGLGYLSGGAALKLLQNGGKSLEFLKLLGKGKSQTDKFKKGTQFTAGLTNTLTLNQAEGVGIAANVFNQSYQDELERLEGEGANIKDEQIQNQAKKIASEKAASVVNFNRTNILLNLTSAFAFLKTPALTRQLRNAPSLRKSGKRTLLEGLQEAGEETINLVSEEQAYDDNYTFEKAIKDIATKEGAESAILGFVGGAGQTALTNAGRLLKIGQDNEGNRLSRNDRQRNAYARQQESLERISTLDKATKLSDVTDAYMKANETIGLYRELEKAINNEDNTKVQKISDMLLSNQAYDAFSNGTTEQYLNVFKGIQELSPEEAELKGLDKNTYKEDSAKAITRIEALEQEYNKAQNYLNFNEVYDNRARVLGLKDNKTELEKTLSKEREQVISDLSDLGIKEDTLNWSDTGGLTFNNYNRYGDTKKANINNLQSLKDYKSTKEQIVKTSQSLKRLTETYTKLISDERQKKVRNLIKEQQKRKKDAIANAKLSAKKRKEEDKVKKTNTRFKESVASEETEVEVEQPDIEDDGDNEVNESAPIEEVETVEDNKIPVEFTFEFVDKEFEAQANETIKGDLPLETKINGFRKVIENLQSQPSTPELAGMLVQYRNAVRHLETLKETTNIKAQTQKAATEQNENEMGELMTDLAPLSESEELNEEEARLIRARRKMKNVLKRFESIGIDITSFEQVAIQGQKAIGAVKFSEYFDRFRNMYNIVMPEHSSTLEYGDIFYPTEVRKRAIKNQESIDRANGIAELYALTNPEYRKSEKKALVEFVEEQGYKVYKGDYITSEDVKIVEGYNKLAHLDKKYKKVVKVARTGTFNVLDFVTSKKDLDNRLNDNASQLLLNYDKFGKGNQISFTVLDEVVYDDGSIAYADGRIEKNGVVTQNDPVDTAPIAVVFNGELLKGTYLHTTEWINEDNIANLRDVDAQKAFLTKIRQTILDSPTEITTTITHRSNGHFLVDVNGITNTVKKNLPNVEIAIGKDNALFISDNETVETSNKTIEDGRIYAVMPVNKGIKYGVPVQRASLSSYPEYVNSILEAVRLYLNNNARDKRAIKLLEEAQIDITRISGLKTYLEKLLFITPKLDQTSFKFDDFKEYISRHVREDASIIRIVTDPNNPRIANLEFGRGADVGATIRFINRDIINSKDPYERNKLINTLLAKLENVLNNNTKINIVKANFNTNFELPIISKGDVVIKEQPYNDFAKEHLLTSLYSYTLEDGKEIYTVQPNLEFDTSFAFKSDGIKAEPEIPKVETVEDIDVSYEEELGFNPFEDLDNETEDLAPKTLTEEEQIEYEENIPDNLFVKGVSISLQDTIINHLTSKVLANMNNTNDDPLSVIDEFANKELRIRIKILRDLLDTDLSEDKYKRAKRNLEIALAVQDEFPKIVKLVLDNLQHYHNVIKKGKKLETIKDALDNDEIGFDDFDTLVNEEGELTEYNAWESDGAFRQDFKRQVSQEIKNHFSYIEDVKELKLVKDTLIAIPKKVWGIPVNVPFDQVFNELSSILAYSNSQEVNNNITIPTFDSMIDTINEWVEAKPYLHNVVKVLESLPTEIQNKFVGVMSKSYTHHTYIFKRKDGRLFIDNSDSNDINTVLQTEWLNNIYDSNLITSTDTAYIINEKEVNTITRESKELIKALQEETDEVIFNKAKSLLDKMGFKFSDIHIKDLINEGVFYNKKRFSLLRLLTESDGVFKIYINRLNSIKNLDAQENNPFGNNSALNKFTRQVAKKRNVYFANSFKDVRGRTYYGYSNNKFITDRTKALKTNSKDILTKLEKQPFSTNSWWVKQFKTSAKFREHFGYFTVDGLSKEGTRGKKLEHMSPAELEEQKLAYFYSQNKVGNNYILNLLYPTTSDKSVSYGIKLLGVDWNKSLKADNTLTPKRLDWLFDQIVSPEINRILAIQDNPTRWNIKGYKEGGTMFNFIPSLNNLKDIWLEEDGIRKLNPSIVNNGNLREKAKQEFSTFITTLIERKIDTWTKYGFVEETEEGSWDPTTGREFTVINKTLKYAPKNSLQSEAGNFVINYLIANINIFQTFTTDPAFYWKSKHWQNVAQRLVSDNVLEEAPSTREEVLQYYTYNDWVQEHEDLFDNMGKRLGADAAPGIDIPNSPNETFNLGIIADNIRPSYLIDYYTGLLKNKANAYFRVNPTDAQEFTSLKEHLHLLHLQGDITELMMKDLIYKDNNELPLTDNELEVILQPVKPVYVNNIWNDGVEHRLYVKSSSFPLFKQLTKGLELDKLRKYMAKKSIDRVAFESAVKIGGTVNPSNIYNSDNVGTIKKNFEIDVIQAVPREGFKIQQKLPYKDSATTINDGTQQRKLLTSTVRDIKGFKLNNSDELVTGQKVQDLLDIEYGKLFKIGYDNLIKELDFDINEGTINMKKLQEILIEEALSRNYPLYDIEALKVVDGEFIVPLWLTGVSGKLEAMLNSIVDNRVRKLTPKGKSYILGTSEGFKVLEGNIGEAYLNSTEGIIYDREWADRKDKQLLPMRIEDASGNLKGEEGFDEKTARVKPAEILVPFKFKDDKGNLLNMEDFITSDGKIDITKLDPKLLEMFGFRIPTQGLSSMTYVKVVGFLPKQSGDLLIAPAEWTVQMGSDFDIDKLFTNSYNTTFKDGKLTKYNGESEKLHIENNILDLHFSILGSTNEEVQSKILSPLDMGKLPDVINEIYPYIDDVLKGISISEEYQTYKYKNARAAKSGIGIFSMDSTFLASIQNKDIKLMRVVKGDIFPYRFEIGGVKSNNLSNPNTNINNRTKADIISALQSLAVDNENEQGMHKLNINKHTFDAIRTLALSGFEEDIIFYFLNQPIIRKYVELTILAEDTVTNYKTNQIMEDIKKLYPLDDEGMDVNTFYKLYTSPSKEELLSMIKEGTPNPNLQRGILRRFIEFTEYGKQIQSVQSAINSDSAGLGKNLFYASAKQTQLVNLDNKIIVDNAHNLIGEYITLLDGKGDDFEKGDNINVEDDIYNLLLEWWKGGLTNKRKKEIVKELQDKGYIATGVTTIKGNVKDTIKFIKPNTINGYASVYGLLLNNSLWGEENFFPYNNFSIINSIESIKALTGLQADTINENAELSKKVFTDIKSFLSTKFPNTYIDGEIVEERERLLIDNDNNISIANIVRILKEQGKISNAFINRIESDIKKVQLPSNISYNAAVVENINERAIYAALSQMLTNDKTVLGEFNGITYTPKVLAQDLIAHQLLTGGVQKSKQFIKYIPINYLKAVGFYDTIKNMNLLNEQEFNPKSFETQYIQHNPSEVVLNNLERLNNYTYYNNNTVILPKGKDTKPLPNIFSIPDIKTVSGYRLYQYDNTSKTWKQIDTLGYKGIMEYDANRSVGNTIIPLNKVPEVTDYTIPKTEEEITDALQIHKRNSEDVEVIYDASTTSISDYFNLRSTDTSLNKLKYILTKINNNSDNRYNSFLAQELYNNSEKLKEYRFIVDTSLQAKGSFNLSDKTIKINPNNIESKTEFENVILEEIIHAYTKEAIILNKHGEVARLKSIRTKAEELVKAKLGESADIKFNTVKRKLKERIPLNKEEETLIYPVINDVEFVGRLFKSKELQELLNEVPSDIEGKSMLDKFFDLIMELLQSIGINVNKGSALEYATIDIISLINQPPPSSSIKGEMKNITKVVRTPDFIYDLYNLKDEEGNLKELPIAEADKIVNWVNENVSNLSAKRIDGFVSIINKLEEDLAPTSDEISRGALLLKSINNRIKRLEVNIEKAEKRKDFKKVEELKDVLEQLQYRRDGYNEKGENDDNIMSVMAITRVADMVVKGEQDMQEVAEMLNRKVTLEDTLYIRKVIHFWKTAKDNLFNEDELQSNYLLEQFSNIKNEAEKHELVLTTIENEYMEKLMNKYGNSVTVESVFNHFRDINGLQRDYLDISRSNNTMLDSIYLTVKDANIDALDETKVILSELEELERKIRPTLKRLGNKELYDIFRQRTVNGKLTGHLVNRYSTDFNKDRRNMKRVLNNNNVFKNYHDFIEWSKKNTKHIELKYLFPTTELNEKEKEEAKKYKENLKQELGETHYNDFIKEQTRLLENYENFKQGRLERIADKYNIEIKDIADTPDASTEFGNWLLVNSPYIFYSNMKDGNYGRAIGYKNFNSPNFVFQIPKDETGYDNNFKTIENNSELLEFYKYYTKVDKELKQYMPSETRTQLAFKGIPFIEKVLFDEYRDKGMKIGLTPIYDTLKKNSRTSIEGTVTHSFVDPVTEIEEKRLGVNLTQDNSEEFFGYIKSKSVEYKLKTGNEPTQEMLDTWSEEITHKLAQKKSYDLPKVLRVYALTVLAYKHKAKIEDSIKLAQNILSEQQELPRNSKGEVLTDPQGRISYKSPSTSFVNTKKQFDYFVQVFYGKTKENEGVTEKKIYTKEEKLRIANYQSIIDELKIQYEQGKITPEEYEEYVTDFNNRINNIGGVAVWSKRGDGILKYVQLKSMGWNLMSSIANIGFGFIANKIEAAGGALYTSKQLAKAYRMVWGSLIKNWTFNKIETPQTKKIRSMMDNWDVLKDATHELFQNPLNIELSKKGKWLAPYNLTQRTEYLNQAPIMIALMMNTKVQTGNGEINMWEGYDNDGLWKVDEYGKEPLEIVKKLRNKIDQINKMNHGNYDGNSPLRVKNEFKGRALSQFRTWMFEGIATRFENYKIDPVIGVKKGRYRSVLTYFKAVGASKFAMNTIKGILNNVSFGTVFKDANFEDAIDGKTLQEIDAQNMRKVMMEVVLLSGIYTSYLMLNLMAGELDDERDAKKKYAINVLINQGIRLKTDIMFYLHPGEFRNLLRDLVPAASLVKDTFEFIDATGRFIANDDEISTGVYSGNSRLLRETAQALPFGTQVYKNINYAIQTFDK